MPKTETTSFIVTGNVRTEVSPMTFVLTHYAKNLHAVFLRGKKTLSLGDCFWSILTLFSRYNNKSQKWSYETDTKA